MVTVMSLGGSLIVPDAIDSEYLKRLRELLVSRYPQQFAIVCGGGATARKYVEAAMKISDLTNAERDRIGILATRVNGELVRAIFGDHAEADVLYDPTEAVMPTKQILVVAGYKPGWSTDYVATLVAQQLGAETVINLTNVSYVYSEDPRKNPDAKPLKDLSWDAFKKLVGGEWKAGMHAPFDPIASKRAETLGLRVMITDGHDLDNLKCIFDRQAFKGTIIQN